MQRDSLLPMFCVHTRNIPKLERMSNVRNGYWIMFFYILCDRGYVSAIYADIYVSEVLCTHSRLPACGAHTTAHTFHQPPPHMHPH